MTMLKTYQLSGAFRRLQGNRCPSEEQEEAEEPENDPQLAAPLVTVLARYRDRWG
jgi:hypothetical protein